MFPQTTPTDQGTTPVMNQQSTQLLGSPPIQAASANGAGFNPGALNNTALQANPAVANMIRALKGNANG